MTKLRTMGRWPTKGELIEYYSRHDICAVVYYQSKRWKILMQFEDNYLLEPTSERDVREKVVQRLCDFAKDVKETERLNRYPTMHMLRNRGEGASVRYDFMVENDPPSWNQAFANMAKALDVLDAHDVYYRIKFSGHRSLHLLIPAEAFPTTFRGKDINEQFNAIQKRIMGYLPKPGHATPGLRLVYSTHPRGGMVSIPLRREELPNFQPWMANIYTVAVDYDWFSVPDDAVERNEKFLHTVFDRQRTDRVTVNQPVFEPLPVKTYAGDTLLSEVEIRKAIASEHYQERVVAARAALIQNIQFPNETLKELLHDTEQDVLWFGMQIVLRDAQKIEVEAVAYLLGKEDDYLLGLGHQLLTQSTEQAEALCDYLISQGEINRNILAATRVITGLSWPDGKGIFKSVVERGSRKIAYALQKAIENGHPYDEVREYVQLLRKHDIGEIMVFSEAIQLLLPQLLHNLSEGNVSSAHFSILQEIWENKTMQLWTIRELSKEVNALCDYLISQDEVNQNTTGIVRLLATLDWQMFEKLPTRIQTASLQEWFAHVWVVCGSALCLKWKHKPEPIFENAYLQAKKYEVGAGLKHATTEEVADKIHQLKLLFSLRNTQPHKRLEDAPLFQAADELIQYGHDLRGIVLAMLESEHPHVACGAVRFLTRLWWDDCIELLIQQLDASKSRRKTALKALVDIGIPAVEPLMEAINTSGNRRIIVKSTEALGRLGISVPSPCVST